MKASTRRVARPPAADPIVSRDEELLSLADATTVEGCDFRTRFPDWQALPPPQLLAVLEPP